MTFQTKNPVARLLRWVGPAFLKLAASEVPWLAFFIWQFWRATEIKALITLSIPLIVILVNTGTRRAILDVRQSFPQARRPQPGPKDFPRLHNNEVKRG